MYFDGDRFLFDRLRRFYDFRQKRREREKNGKVIVVYFSFTGNTKGVAEKIAQSLACDVTGIEPKTPYTDSDLNYNDGNSRANNEQNDDSARPAIGNAIENLDDYSTIFVGFPIWWGKMPKIMYTFFESYDLSGKTIIPFCTSGGSGISTSVDEIKSLAKDSTVENGKRFSESASQKEVDNWIKSLKII